MADLTPENRAILRALFPDQCHTLELHGDASFHVSEIQRLMTAVRVDVLERLTSKPPT